MWVYIEWRRISFTLHGRKSIQMNNKTNIARWNWRRWHFNMSTRLPDTVGGVLIIELNWFGKPMHSIQIDQSMYYMTPEWKTHKELYMSGRKLKESRKSNEVSGDSQINGGNLIEIVLSKILFYMQAPWFLIFYSWLLKAEHANQQEIKHEKKNREENLNELARVGRCVFIIAYNYE